MFKLRSQLPRSNSALWDHIDALKEIKDQDAHQKLFDHLYSCLSILDSKSASLLQFNSIIIAVFALFLTRENGLGLFGGISVGVGMAAVIISSLLLLSVAWVHWSTTEDFKNADGHAFNLLKVRIARTIKYRLAWYLAVTSVISLSVFLAGKLFL